MALSGVRSSWLMLARNCDLCLLAISSCRPLSSISLEQPRVLDRQHRLRRKGLQQVDRQLRRTRPALAAHHQRADDALVAQQRHDQQRR